MLDIGYLSGLESGTLVVSGSKHNDVKAHVHYGAHSLNLAMIEACSNVTIRNCVTSMSIDFWKFFLRSSLQQEQVIIFSTASPFYLFDGCEVLVMWQAAEMKFTRLVHQSYSVIKHVTDYKYYDSWRTQKLVGRMAENCIPHRILNSKPRREGDWCKEIKQAKIYEGRVVRVLHNQIRELYT